jgi:hypothetical protein
MKKLIQLCLVVVVLACAVSCAPSGAAVSAGVGYAPPVYVRPVPVRPFYGYRYYYAYPRSHFYHYRRY